MCPHEADGMAGKNRRFGVLVTRLVGVVAALGVLSTPGAGEDTCDLALGEAQHELYMLHAARHKIGDEDKAKLWEDLSHHISLARAQDLFAAWRSRGADIVPLLIELAADKRVPIGFASEESPMTLSKLHHWLGCMRDDRATEYLLDTARGRLREGVYERLDIRFYDALFVGLGWTRSDEALDFLFGVQSQEYWNRSDAPVVRITDAEGNIDERFTGYVKRQIQLYALIAIQRSGTKRALDAIVTSEGINNIFQHRLPYYFEEAVLEYVGVIGNPLRRGLPLPEGKLEEIKAVYREYGKKFVPPKVDPPPPYPE